MLLKNRHREKVHVFLCTHIGQSVDFLTLSLPFSLSLRIFLSPPLTHSLSFSLYLSPPSLSLFSLRALEVWGSWHVLEYELKLRRHLAEEQERRRKGLGALIAQLKKYNKTQVRKEIDKEVCWGRSWCVCVFAIPKVFIAKLPAME